MLDLHVYGCILIEDEPLSFQLREHLFWERMSNKGLKISTTQVQSYIIRSCLARYDEAGAEELLRDWCRMRVKPAEYVHKFQPGSHYYALDEKFATEFAAREHLRKNGYECLGVNTKYVYARQGD
jgi:hypothetical protein